MLELVTLFAPEAAFLTEPIAFVISALGLAWELLDHPFSRRGLGVGERLRWMKESAFAVIGFAIAAQVFLLIPGIDLFLLPVGSRARRASIETVLDSVLETAPHPAPHRNNSPLPVFPSSCSIPSHREARGTGRREDGKLGGWRERRGARSDF